MACGGSIGKNVGLQQRQHTEFSASYEQIRSEVRPMAYGRNWNATRSAGIALLLNH